MSKYRLGPRLWSRLQRRVVRPLTERVVVPGRRWSNRGRVFRPIFVAGTMGSGTTLMAFSLAKKFRCAGVVAESGHQVAERSPLRVRHPHEFESVAEYLESLRPGPEWSIAGAREDLQQLYRGYASGPASTMIDKGPNIHLLRAAFLHRCFPESWFVLVFRDPVANVEGFRRKWAPFGEEALDSSLHFYEETHRVFLEETRSFRQQVVGVSYEAFVEHHDETLDAIARKIGLEPADSSLRLPSRPDVPGQGIRNVRANRIGLVTDANQRAYEALSAAEVQAIEARLRPLYERLENETARSLDWR